MKTEITIHEYEDADPDDKLGYMCMRGRIAKENKVLCFYVRYSSHFVQTIVRVGYMQTHLKTDPLSEGLLTPFANNFIPAIKYLNEHFDRLWDHARRIR